MHWFLPFVLGFSDQVIKQLFLANQHWQVAVGDFVRFFMNYYANPVAAFSLPVPAKLIVPASLLILIVLAGVFIRTKSSRVRFAVLFILIGAVSNLIDRAQYGFVIDYFGISIAGWRSSLFNLADLMILAGLIIWLKAPNIKAANP